jgi:hypothetical protein
MKLIEGFSDVIPVISVNDGRILLLTELAI